MANPAAARHFERVARGYTQLREGGLNGVLRRQEQQAVHALARIDAGERVLDAGCGDGAVLAWIAERGARPIGIDFVWPMAAHCRGRGFDVTLQDMEQLGFRPAFDWVLCIGSLEFTRNPGQALAGFAASLRPGGHLVLLFPRRGWLGSLYAAYHRLHGLPIWLFSRSEVETLLAGAALSAEEWRHCLLSSVCRARKRPRPDAT